MQHSSIEQIDRAVLVLVQALSEHREGLARHFESGHLEWLEADLTTLRQAPLGLQIGALYRDAGSAEEVGIGGSICGRYAGFGGWRGRVLTGAPSAPVAACSIAVDLSAS